MSPLPVLVSDPVFRVPLSESFLVVRECVHTLDHHSCVLLCSPDCYTRAVIC